MLVLWYQAMRKPSSGNVPVFWKLITQANFHGRGPPPRSFIRYAFKRPMVAAQAGAGMRVEAATVVVFDSPDSSPAARSRGGMSGRG